MVHISFWTDQVEMCLVLLIFSRDFLRYLGRTIRKVYTTLMISPSKEQFYHIDQIRHLTIIAAVRHDG